jgi:two-component sensor histidine kinase
VTIARQLCFSLERLRAEEERKKAEEAKELVVSESRHRIKNTLAMVQAISSQTLRHLQAKDLEPFLARLHALGEAHDLLSTDSWDQAALGDVIGALNPFQTGESDRIVVEGPHVSVPARTSLMLTLCLHELATNAAKYGALSNGARCVHVTWDLADTGTVKLTWRESGGPPVSVPARKGFGSLLIEQSFSVEG